MTDTPAVTQRMARFAEELAFLRLGRPGPRRPPSMLDRACFCFAQSLYPDGQAGAVVLDRGATAQASDAAVRRHGDARAWLTTIDEAGGPDLWWYSRGARPTAQRFRGPTDDEELLYGKPTRSCLYTSGGSTHRAGMRSSVADVPAGDV